MHPGIHSPNDRAAVERSSRARRVRVCVGLVHGAMLLGVLPLLTSCLVDEPPEFHDKERTAPILYLDRFDPPTTPYYRVSSNRTIPFSIWLQSEDLGEDLVAYPWVNFDLGPPTARLLQPQGLSPGVFSEPRGASFFVTIDPLYFKQGCVPLTVLFFHEGDYDPIHVGIPAAGAPYARADWLLLVDKDPSDVTFADCPQISVEQPSQQ